MLEAWVFYGIAASLFGVGVYAVLTRKHLVKIIMGLGLMEAGVNLFIVEIGYVFGRTAPILSTPELQREALRRAVDPVPQALVLTAIVIGVAVLALALSMAVQLYKKRGTLDVSQLKEMRW